MTFTAIIIKDSELDVLFRTEKLDKQTVFGNLFELIEDNYVCEKVKNLIPLLKIEGIEIMAFARLDRSHLNNELLN